MARELWMSGDGNGGFDIGEGDFTIAHVRNLEAEDGKAVASAYRQAFASEPRETALLFKASPLMLEALERVAASVAHGEHADNIADSGALVAVADAIAIARGE